MESGSQSGTNIQSPSSRRAWIEILARFSEISGKQVALLTEGVDRNIEVEVTQELVTKSPSSRRAWIEMTRKPAT